MRASLQSFAIVAVAISPLACGGAPPAQNTTPVAVATPPPVIATAPPADLSPVAEPADVIGIARWRNPSESFGIAEKWFGVPVPLAQVLDEMFEAKGAQAVVVTEAPVDGLVALDPAAKDKNPQPFAAFSVGLRSVADAKQLVEQQHKTREVHPGVYTIELGAGADIRCLIAPSVGVANARLVCGPRERDIEALYPYMTRGLPTVKLPNADLHAELKFAPVKQKYGPLLPDALRMASSFLVHELGTGDRRVDRALTDTANGLFAETEAFVRDIDGMTYDITSDPTQRSIRADIAIKTVGQDSWLVQRSFENAAEAGPPPAIFWRAPKDADSVFYGRPQNGKVYEGIRRALDDMADAFLAQQSMDAADRKNVTSLVDRLFSGNPTLVSCSGHIEAPATAKKGERDEVEDVMSGLGWFLYGVEEGPERAMGFLKELASTYNKPSMQKWLKDKAKSDAKSLPTVRVTPFTAKGITGAQVLELKINVPEKAAPPSAPGAKKAAAKPKMRALSFYVVVMPDGPRTWIAASADRAAIESHLLAVKSGAPDSGTIATRTGIEELKATRAVSGGFMTMAGAIAQQRRSGMGLISGHKDAKMLEALARVPNHGETPILLTSTAQKGNPGVIAAQLQINKGTIDDIASFVVATMGIRNRKH